MLSGEATNTNFIVFGLTLLGLEHTIYRSQGEDANDLTTNMVHLIRVASLSSMLTIHFCTNVCHTITFLFHFKYDMCIM